MGKRAGAPRPRELDPRGTVVEGEESWGDQQEGLRRDCTDRSKGNHSLGDLTVEYCRQKKGPRARLKTTTVGLNGENPGRSISQKNTNRRRLERKASSEKKEKKGSLVTLKGQGKKGSPPT